MTSPYRTPAPPSPERKSWPIWQSCGNCQFAAVGGCLGRTCIRKPAEPCAYCTKRASRVTDLGTTTVLLCSTCWPPPPQETR